jgi:hypothetical protein
MLMETALAMLFPVLCILMLAGKIVPGWPGSTSVATRNRRVRVSASGVANLPRQNAIDEVVQ